MNSTRNSSSTGNTRSSSRTGCVSSTSSTKQDQHMKRGSGT
ncbi:hypothetical protein ACFYU9_26490 [Streptomyces sp. NPDC004327]